MLLHTLSLSGASGVDAYAGETAYDSIYLKITAVTGTVTGLVRSTD